MVKRIAPVLLVLLAACGGVSGNPPGPEDWDPDAGAVFDGKGAPLSPGDSDALLKRHEAQGFPVFAEDELRFTVHGRPELSFESKVPGEGSIHYPMIGSVTLAGRSIDEIRQDIETRLEKDYLVDAQVTVQVRTYAPKRVYVHGAVGHPGSYEIPGGKSSTLMQAVAQAGGFTEDAARHSVMIYRAREFGSAERVGVMVDVGTATGFQDPMLLPNDLVFVPARDRIYVYGQVARPGAFPCPADKKITATQAIALAGGFTRIANDGSIRLSRRTKTGSRENFALNLSEGKVEDDKPLQPGDVIFVPESIF